MTVDQMIVQLQEQKDKGYIKGDETILLQIQHGKLGITTPNIHIYKGDDSPKTFINIICEEEFIFADHNQKDKAEAQQLIKE